MLSAPPLLKQPTGVYGLVVAALLAFCPPLGLALLAIKNPWTKRTGNVVALLSTAWLAVVIVGLFHLPSDPPVDPAAELAEFQSFVDRAIEIRNSIDELQDSFTHEKRAGNLVTSESFHRQSLAIRKQVEGLRVKFRSRFGTEIGEYRMSAKGRNDQLFLRASETVNRLEAIWQEWNSLAVSGGSAKTFDMHDQLFWEAVNASRSLLSGRNAFPPKGSKTP